MQKLCVYFETFMTTFELEENREMKDKGLCILKRMQKALSVPFYIKGEQILKLLRLMLSFVFVLLKANPIREKCNAFHRVHLFRVFIEILKFRY